jgi:DNA repair photolyase
MQISKVTKDKSIQVCDVVDSILKFKYILDIYEGCNLQCPYCFKDMEENIIKADVNIIKNLEKELLELKEVNVIAIGVNKCEPYQDIEKKLMITRKALEIIKLNKFPVHIITKSTLIQRDIDLLKEISKNNWCYVSFSFSTFDEKLRKVLEPETEKIEHRLKVIEKLIKNDINCGILLMPLMPYITDKKEDLEPFFEFAKENNISYVVDNVLALNNEKDRMNFFTYMQNTPKLKRFVKRYIRLYDDRKIPYGKVMQQLSRNLFDLSKEYNVSRAIPNFVKD